MFTADIESFWRKFFFFFFALYIEIIWPPVRMTQLLLNLLQYNDGGDEDLSERLVSTRKYGAVFMILFHLAYTLG